MRKATWALAILAVMGMGVATRADFTPVQTVVIPAQTTNWNEIVTFDKFDPSLGTLEKIHFSLKGIVEGTIKVENLDAQQAKVFATLQTTLTLTRPDDSTIVVSIPVALETFNLAAFDGSIDFAGASGSSSEGLTSMVIETVVSPPPNSDLSLFTGPGTISLPLASVGTSSASGAGNLVTQFSTMAGAEVSIKYEYVAVPEPSSVALMGLGGFGLMAMARRRYGRSV